PRPAAPRALRSTWWRRGSRDLPLQRSGRGGPLAEERVVERASPRAELVARPSDHRLPPDRCAIRPPLLRKPPPKGVDWPMVPPSQDWEGKGRVDSAALCGNTTLAKRGVSMEIREGLTFDDVL